MAGDWAMTRPGVRPGGWAFQYENPYYPDVDDTAAVALALDRFDRDRYRFAIDRAAEWIIGMQSRNGGWGSFDADNTHYYLNHIPFADHGALLDPPTADVSARCLGLLASSATARTTPPSAPPSPICGASRKPTAAGSDAGAPTTSTGPGRCWPPSTLPASIRRHRKSAAPSTGCWPGSVRMAAGAKREESYWPGRPRGEAPYSTASQTAWALLALMAAGEVRNPAVARGIAYLIATQKSSGSWDEPWFTAVGFPRVFFLRYHGYRAYFPLWALARYRRLINANSARVPFGI